MLNCTKLIGHLLAGRVLLPPTLLHPRHRPVGTERVSVDLAQDLTPAEFLACGRTVPLNWAT